MRKKFEKMRRQKGKTDYKARMSLLKSGKTRIVFRKTNRHAMGQGVKSREAQDYVLAGANSKELMEYGWPESASGSLKSIPACYLAGFLLGKKLLDKDVNEGIFDIGLLRSIKKSRAYAFLKGVSDAGIKINTKPDVFPDEKRIKGLHMKSKVSDIFSKIKEKIEKKFV